MATLVLIVIVVVVAAGWVLVSVTLALILGRVIRARDQNY